VNAYLDSSVVLRFVLGQPGMLPEWERIVTGIASALVEVECFRTLDRLRLRARFTDAAFAARREQVFQLLELAEIIEPDRTILTRAAQPLPTELGTLDAIHLATAILWRDQAGTDLVMATHDIALGMAARASGLRVVGLG
jgi:predicted nucleic acid-binding protein